jgi:hypothetical protein
MIQKRFCVRISTAFQSRVPFSVITGRMLFRYHGSFVMENRDRCREFRCYKQNGGGYVSLTSAILNNE